MHVIEGFPRRPDPTLPGVHAGEPDMLRAHIRMGARLYGLGALGLVLTCVLYVLAGPLAALPGGASSPAAGLAATADARTWMRLAGLAGMPSDVLLAVGAMLLALRARTLGSATALAGWLCLAVASALFIVVDAMVSMVLPALAVGSAEAALPAYAGLRALFDVLFMIGTLTAGAGALAVAWHRDETLFQRPWVGWSLRAAGSVCVLASASALCSGAGAGLIGPGVALLALASAGAAYVLHSSAIDTSSAAESV